MPTGEDGGTITFMQVRRERDPRLTGFARSMRQQPTDAEKKLWQILRGKALGGYRFRRQRPVAGYIVDFYCAARRLAVELDGGQHADDRQADYDRTRTARLKDAGVRVLRFWDPDVLTHPDAVAEEIVRHLQGEMPPPLPSPGVPGEGDQDAHFAAFSKNSTSFFTASARAAGASLLR